MLHYFCGRFPSVVFILALKQCISIRDQWRSQSVGFAFSLYFILEWHTKPPSTTPISKLTLRNDAINTINEVCYF